MEVRSQEKLQSLGEAVAGVQVTGVSGKDLAAGKSGVEELWLWIPSSVTCSVVVPSLPGDKTLLGNS